MTKVKIVSKRTAPFKGRDGEEVQYTWYKALRLSDQTTIEFGSREGEHEVDETYDLELEKRELPRGGYGYRELV